MVETVKPSGPEAKRRKVVYPKVEIRDHSKPEGEEGGKGFLTADKCRDYLGFREAKSGEPYIMKGFLMWDKDGNPTDAVGKITCDLNCCNRHFVPSVFEDLKQDILNRHWTFNGETAIVGKTALVLDGQHTFMGVIQAEGERLYGKGKHHWNEIWKNKPIEIKKLIVCGIDEDDGTVNTINTCRPRNLSDVIYRSPYFRSLPPDARNVVSNITAKCVQTLWVRLGYINTTFTSRRSHSEAIDLIDRHPKILEAARHIYEEDGNKDISAVVSPGLAAALLFLMASCKSDVDGYRNSDEPGDDDLDFTMWDKACEFWVLIGSKSEVMKPVRDYLAKLMSDEEVSMGVLHRIGVLVKAWNRWIEGGPLSRSDVSLKFITNDKNGKLELDHNPTCGGVDLGQKTDQKSQGRPEPDEGDEISPEDLEARKEEERKNRQQADKQKEDDRRRKEAERVAAKIRAQRDKKAAEAASKVTQQATSNGEAVSAGSENGNPVS